MGTYFSFIGSIFTTIWEAIFGKPKKQEDTNPAKQAEERIKALEKNKKDIAEEVTLSLGETPTQHFYDLSEELKLLRLEIQRTRTSGALSSSFGANLLSSVQYGDGGLLDGPSHDQGGIDLGVVGKRKIEAEGGEYIIRKDSVEKLGTGVLNYINERGHLPFEPDIFKTSSMMSQYVGSGPVIEQSATGEAVQKFSDGGSVSTMRYEDGTQGFTLGDRPIMPVPFRRTLSLNSIQTLEYFLIKSFNST